MKSRRQRGGNASSRPDSSPRSIVGHICQIGLRRVVAVEPVGSREINLYKFQQFSSESRRTVETRKVRLALMPSH
jgi:hypothetical protein